MDPLSRAGLNAEDKPQAIVVPGLGQNRSDDLQALLGTGAAARAPGDISNIQVITFPVEFLKRLALKFAGHVDKIIAAGWRHQPQSSRVSVGQALAGFGVGQVPVGQPLELDASTVADDPDGRELDRHHRDRRQTAGRKILNAALSASADPFQNPDGGNHDQARPRQPAALDIQLGNRGQNRQQHPKPDHRNRRDSNRKDHWHPARYRPSGVRLQHIFPADTAQQQQQSGDGNGIAMVSLDTEQMDRQIQNHKRPQGQHGGVPAKTRRDQRCRRADARDPKNDNRLNLDRVLKGLGRWGIRLRKETGGDRRRPLKQRQKGRLTQKSQIVPDAITMAVMLEVVAGRGIPGQPGPQHPQQERNQGRNEQPDGPPPLLLRRTFQKIQNKCDRDQGDAFISHHRGDRGRKIDPAGLDKHQPKTQENEKQHRRFGNRVHLCDQNPRVEHRDDGNQRGKISDESAADQKQQNAVEHRQDGVEQPTGRQFGIGDRKHAAQQHLHDAHGGRPLEAFG